MGAEDNRKAVRQFYDGFNRRETGMIFELLAEDFVDHGIPEELGQDREALEQFLQMYYDAFPDVRIEAQDVIAEGDLVASRIHMTGTHEGDFMGIPATGRHVDVEGCDFVRFNDDGKAVEHWDFTDNLKIMQQLGVVPEHMS